MKKLFEIALTIVLVLVLILNGHSCLFSMCFGICYMPGIYFIQWVYYHFVFSKKFQKLDSDLNDCFQKLEVILESLKCQEEAKKKFFVNNYVPLPPDDFYLKSKLQDVLRNLSQYFANAQITNFDIIYRNLQQKKMDHSLDHYQTILKKTLANLTNMQQTVW